MRSLMLIALIFIPLAARAAPSESGHYRICMANTQKNPSGALTDGESWARDGGGVPAQHCAALALVSLKRYGEAGARLYKFAGD